LLPAITLNRPEVASPPPTLSTRSAQRPAERRATWPTSVDSRWLDHSHLEQEPQLAFRQFWDCSHFEPDDWQSAVSAPLHIPGPRWLWAPAISSLWLPSPLYNSGTKWGSACIAGQRPRWTGRG